MINFTQIVRDWWRRQSGTTANKVVVKDANGLPTEGTNTNAEISATVTASHAAAHTLDSHSNVTMAGKANNDIVQWDDPSSKWVNRTLAAAGIASSSHKARHENGGADEISVAGLSGELADAQPPKAHAIDGAEHTGEGNCVTKDVGTAAGTVAAGDHAHATYLPLAGGTMTGRQTLCVLNVTGLSGTYNDYNPAGFSNCQILKVNQDVLSGGVVFTGFAAATEGTILVVYGADPTLTVTLNHADGGSVAANQIFNETGAAIIIPPYGSSALQYTAGRWRPYDKMYDIRGAAAAAITTAEAYADGIAGTGPTSFRQKGTDPIELWYPAGPLGAGGGLSISTPKDRLYAMPFIAGKGGTLDRIGFWVSTLKAGSHAMCGIYTNKAIGQLYPGAWVISGNSEDTSTTGLKATTISQVLTPGVLYWFVFTAGGVTGVYVLRTDVLSGVTFGVQADLVSGMSGYYVVRVYDGTLPDPFPDIAGATILTTIIPTIACRFSS